MASGSSKKKPKRSSHQPSSSMAYSSPFLNCRRNSLILSALMIFCVLILLYITLKASTELKSEAISAKIYSIEVVNEFPHDPTAFTQGLLYGGNDILFESTGIYKQSTVRKVALQTGQIEVLHKMDDSYFGEGLTLLGKRLFQVTWLKQTGFIYDLHNLTKVKKFTHQMTDGWGLTTDGKVLFGSDGTSTLYQLDPQKFKVIGKETIKFEGHEVHNLNELEYVNGEVWANVWQTDCIARISHKDGIVLGWILLHKLREQLIAAGNTEIDVLNGIAWDEEKNRLFVTGKLWPKLYEIKLHPVTGPFRGSIEQLCLRRPHHF